MLQLIQGQKILHVGSDKYYMDEYRKMFCHEHLSEVPHRWAIRTFAINIETFWQFLQTSFPETTYISIHKVSLLSRKLFDESAFVLS